MSIQKLVSDWLALTLIGHVDGNIKFLSYLCYSGEHLCQLLLQIYKGLCHSRVMAYIYGQKVTSKAL